MKAESQLYFQKSQKLKAEAKFFKVISFSQKPKLNHLAAKHWEKYSFKTHIWLHCFKNLERVSWKWQPFLPSTARRYQNVSHAVTK